MGAEDPERRCLVNRESGPSGALLRLVLSPEGEEKIESDGVLN
jgi:predicted RNA-binding protein YlxR (DUF448 family)